MDKRYKPGPGWKHLAGAVWEHCNGVRIHLGGTAQLPNGDFVFAYGGIEDSLDSRKYIKINGGNRKRGLMAWANSLMGGC